MKRILVERKKLHEETEDAVQYAKDKEQGKIIPHNTAYPMRPKPELSKSNGTEISLPNVD